MLICEECFHDLDFYPHICLIHTCPSCYSSKSIFARYCTNCQSSVPCHYCPTPSTQSIQHIKLCYTHLLRLCNIDVFQRQMLRVARNAEYESNCLRRKTLRHRKFGRPRLAEL